MIDSFTKLPIGKYLDLLKIDKEENLSEVDRQAEILGILADMSAEEVLQLPIVTYKTMVAAAEFLHRPIPEVNYHRIAKSYTLGGWELVPTSDIRKITASQYIDFQTFSKQGQEKMVEMLSCFLVPKGKSYADGYDVIELQHILRECLAVTDVVNLSAFFLNRYAQSIKALLISCKWTMRKMKVKVTQEQRNEMWRRWEEVTAALERGGAGLPRWMQ